MRESPIPVEVVRNIIQLLLRTDIKGHEVPVFNQCMNALTPLAEAPPSHELSVVNSGRGAD